MDRLFGLADFWGRCVETDIQHIQKEIADYFREAGSEPDTSTVRTVLQKRHRDHRRYIGHREQHIYWAALYEHAASSEAIINEAIQQYHQDANATDGVG